MNSTSSESYSGPALTPNFLLVFVFQESVVVCAQPGSSVTTAVSRNGTINSTRRPIWAQHWRLTPSEEPPTPRASSLRKCKYQETCQSVDTEGEVIITRHQDKQLVIFVGVGIQALVSVWDASWENGSVYLFSPLYLFGKFWSPCWNVSVKYCIESFSAGSKSWSLSWF